MADDPRREAEQHFGRGNAFDEQGWRDRAIAEWQEAIHFDPDHPAAHFNLGIAFAEEGDAERAIEHLRAAIRLDPFDVEAKRELAEVFAEQERPDDAINQLRQVLNIAPGDGEAAHRLAELHLDREMWDEAASALEAGAMAEEDADLWYEVGNAYADAQRREDAILAYQRVLVCNPEHREAQEILRQWGVPIEEPPDQDGEPFEDEQENP